MSQPIWKFVANIGDKNFVEYGGLFVYVDTTGVYPPEMELLEGPEEEDASDDDTPDNRVWTTRRVVLDRCTYVDGVLSDNRFHPEHPAWFAAPESRRAARPQDTTYLSNVAQSMGLTMDSLIVAFCSDDPVTLASAYRAVANYHGWENLDDYPITWSRAEVEARYHDVK